MTPENTISIIVPAFNEEGHVEDTIGEVLPAVGDEFDDYEIIIFDDGSGDGTGAEAERAAARHDKVRVVHNPRNMGLGWNYKTGLAMARMRYVMLVNGKHDITTEQLRKILERRHSADIVIPYHTNVGERPTYRRVISRAYTGLLNLLFGLRLHGYNESVLHQTRVVRSFVVRTNSYAFQAEVLIKALKSGCSHVEVPIQNLYPPGVPTKAFRLRNIIGVARFFLSTWRDVYVRREYRHE